MSEGARIPWDDAYDVARRISRRLTPYVARLKCVGSVRRRKATVGDIEFLAEPLMQEDLLGYETPELGFVRRELLDMGTWVQGGERMMQVKHVLGIEGLTLDLYLAHPPASWWSLLAIRTGPAGLGEHVMREMKQYGYRHRLSRPEHKDTGEVVELTCEADFFDLARVRYVVPRERDELLKELRGK